MTYSDHQFSLFTFQETKPTGKVPISKERLEEAKRFMFSDPARAVKALRDVRYSLENYERSLKHK